MLDGAKHLNHARRHRRVRVALQEAVRRRALLEAEGLLEQVQSVIVVENLDRLADRRDLLRADLAALLPLRLLRRALSREVGRNASFSVISRVVSSMSSPVVAISTAREPWRAVFDSIASLAAAISAFFAAESCSKPEAAVSSAAIAPFKSLSISSFIALSMPTISPLCAL